MTARYAQFDTSRHAQFDMARHARPDPWPDAAPAPRRKLRRIAGGAAGLAVAAAAVTAVTHWPGHTPQVLPDTGSDLARQAALTPSRALALRALNNRPLAEYLARSGLSAQRRSSRPHPRPSRPAATPSLQPPSPPARIPGPQLASPSASPSVSSPASRPVSRPRPQPTPSPAAPVPEYLNPLRDVAGLIPERVDMGADFGGSGPVYSLGDAVITNATGDTAGWPGGGWITYRLTDGPAAGLQVYVAEDVRPAVTVGERVTSSTVIATMFDGGDGIETGWAQPDGASAESQLPVAGGISGGGPFPTRIGVNFDDLLQALGVPAGPNAGQAPYGLLPPNYPAGWSAVGRQS